jgi:hypothetical protein
MLGDMIGRADGLWRRALGEGLREKGNTGVGEGSCNGERAAKVKGPIMMVMMGRRW